MGAKWLGEFLGVAMAHFLTIAGPHLVTIIRACLPKNTAEDSNPDPGLAERLRKQLPQDEKPAR